jgi:hypothetical protein
LKKVILIALVVASANASWFGNKIETSLEEAKAFQCKKIEESVKSDIITLQSENSKEVYKITLARVEQNVPLIGTKCGIDYGQSQTILRDLRQMVTLTAETEK